MTSPARSDAWWTEYESALAHEREHKTLAQRSEQAGSAFDEAWERLQQAIPESEGELLDAWNAFCDAYGTLATAQQSLFDVEGAWRNELIDLLNVSSKPLRGR